jgi:hypothetical protein
MARTAAHFTQSEASALETFALTNGLIIEGPQGEKNGEILADFIANKMNSDITAETLAAAFKHVRDQLVLKSPEQIGYEELHAALDSHEQAVFKQFHYGRLKNSYANAFRLLKFLKDRRMPVSEINLRIAAGQLGRGLEYDNPTSSRESGYGRYSSQKFNVEDKNDRTYVNGKKNHAADQHDASQPALAGSNGHWQAKAESVRANLHSQTAAIQRMFVNGPGGEINWKATYEARDRAASGRRGSI